MKLHPEIHGDVPLVPNLGTPIQAARLRALRRAARLRALRRESLVLKAVVIGLALVLIFIALGYLHAQPRPLPMSYRAKAQALPVGKRVCQLDRHEDCLVCLHKEVTGILVSTHC